MCLCWECSWPPRAVTRRLLRAREVQVAAPRCGLSAGLHNSEGDLYEDVMMESDRRPTSQDGSRRRNPPKRCPRPLCSLDRPEENHNVLENHQDENLLNIKVEVIDEEETEANQPYERDLPERCPRPLYSPYSPEGSHNVPENHQAKNLMDIKIEVTEEEDDDDDEEKTEDHQLCKEEEGGPPERCPRPLYSPDHPEGSHNVPENYQGEELTIIKVEIKEEEEEIMVGAPPLVSNMEEEITVCVIPEASPPAEATSGFGTNYIHG
ncbi:uncharacterized protein [Dendrobates tinctorius]|uniref:uncharacterized protein n=1 Tax=Dendrobates tinctorius TaxID=92724 RepID=UPI003CCA15C1